MPNAYEKRKQAREAKRKAAARAAYAARQAKRDAERIRKDHEAEQAEICKADALVHEQEIDPGQD